MRWLLCLVIFDVSTGKVFDLARSQGTIYAISNNALLTFCYFCSLDFESLQCHALINAKCEYYLFIKKLKSIFSDVWCFYVIDRYEGDCHQATMLQMRNVPANVSANP